MDALTYLMAEKSIQNIKITEICEQAQCNRSTFYSNYARKEDLLEELLDTRIESLNRVLSEISQDIPTYNLKITLKPLFQFIYDNRYFLKTVLGDFKVSGFRQVLFDTYKKSIAGKLISKSVFFENDNRLLDLQLNYIASTWLGLTLYWVNQKASMSVEYVTEEYVKILQIEEHKIFTKDWRFSNLKQSKVNKKRKANEVFQVTFLKLLQEKEYKNIQIQNIIEKSGYNRTSFYQNFNDKEALYHSLREEFIIGLLNSFSGSSQKTSSILVEQAPINSVMEYIYENREFLRVMYGKHTIPGFFNYLFTSITEFLEKELLGKELKVDIYLYSNYLMNSLMVIIGGWFTLELRYSPEFISKVLIKIIVDNNELE